jgi:tRNA (guanine10-N2)-dimethyltransferase
MDPGGGHVTRVFVELAGEVPALARAEAIAAAEALGGGARRASDLVSSDLIAVDLPTSDGAKRLAGRLALARRVVVWLGPPSDLDTLARSAGAAGGSAAVRRFGRPSSGGTDPSVRRFGAEFVAGGGRIDLEDPTRRFWLAPDGVYEEVSTVDRQSATARRMPQLPFQRPVSLPPRLARAAANLARIRPGDRVVDPFVGTGSLLAEAGLLGGRLVGVDRDPAMIRGALENLRHLGLDADELVVGDSGAIDVRDPTARFDAVLTDPPYGRSSSTGGESAADLVARVLPRWADRVRPGGRVVIVVSDGSEPLGGEWVRELSIPVRVHRSLTREFRVYVRRSATASPARTP